MKKTIIKEKKERNRGFDDQNIYHSLHGLILRGFMAFQVENNTDQLKIQNDNKNPVSMKKKLHGYSHHLQ